MKKKPWETLPKVWKTEAAFMSYIRSGIRKSIWSRYPVKTEFMKYKRVRGVNPKTGRNCYGGDCYICGKFFAQNDTEVDHLEGNHSMKSIGQVSSYLEALLFIDFDGLGIVCKPCHKIKSYSERMGITFEEARVEKETIAYMKKSVKDIDKVLTKHNLPCNNATVRRKGVGELFKEGLL